MRTAAALSVSLLVLQHVDFFIGPRMEGKSFRTLLCMHDTGIMQEALFLNLPGMTVHQKSNCYSYLV